MAERPRDRRFTSIRKIVELFYELAIHWGTLGIMYALHLKVVEKLLLVEIELYRCGTTTGITSRSALF